MEPPARSVVVVFALPLAVVAMLGLGGCGGDDPSSHASATLKSTPSTAGGSTSTTTTAAPTTTGAPGGTDVGDFAGERFDFGEIKGVKRLGDRVEISFNRQQLYADDGSLQSGTLFTSEPIVYGNTDVPYVDDSPKLRRFVLAPDARVLVIGTPVPCASDEVVAQPTWNPMSLDELVAGGWTQDLEDSLTFGADGHVTQVRLSTAC